MIPSLMSIPLFQGVAPDALAAAEDGADWLSLPAGWPLFRAGERADHLYFVLTGTLAAFRSDPAGQHRLLGYIRAGEPVGEMALIARENHTASVFATRDTELMRLSRPAFEKLTQSCPGLMERIARLMLTRARAPEGKGPARAAPKVYALIATSPTIDLELRARTLQTAMRRLGKTAVIIGEDAVDRPAKWFDDQELKHDAVFLISPIADTTWFRACIRQADRIWFLARADARPSIPLLPDEDPSPARSFRLLDVVLLHLGEDRKAATTDEWRSACGAARVFHWRGVDDADAERLARTISQRAVGLVLSGGGARAYAHIGVVRALREAHIPLDMVGGTSMGAIIAACVAMGWDDEEIEVRIRQAFVESNPLGDYVLPVVGLVRGLRVENRLQEHFGEALIEDLKVPFFCASTNLTTASLRVHRHGLLRNALRATISLPGILPPIVEGDDILVDGAVIRNFPVDVLKETHRGKIIGVDVARQEGIDPKDFIDPPSFFGWVSRYGLQSAPPIASLLMRAATLGADPWRGRDGVDMLVLPEMPNVDLRDWKKFDDAVVAGYEAAVHALRDNPHFMEADEPPQPSPADFMMEAVK
ncbi:MAG: cyclic nucleotide-binding domain-containing protein [Alphaproteobacteria bacterium]|nr:cyclic nucleotide-binding domain-containing protein [Alphaproteobacteria bacterium]